MSVSPNTFTCAHVGAVPSVVLTVTDNNGNVKTCGATVTVKDTVSPTATCKNITVQLDAMGDASIVAGDINNGSGDACGLFSMSASPSSFTCNDVGSNPVTLMVSDMNGNMSMCVATVTVEDTVSPVATCQDITVYLDASGDASITVGDIEVSTMDNCAVDFTNLDITAFDCDDIGTNLVVLTVTDVSGNTGTCTATVEIIDTIGPCGFPTGIIYVDKTKVGGNNNGLSWDDAFLELYDALQAAKMHANARQIWVAAGTYLPTNDSNRDSVFAMVDSVTVFGGFAGNEDSLHHRDIMANMTILSGHIGNPADILDNSKRVVEVAADVNYAGLNGLIIERGISYVIPFTLIRGAGVGCFGELNMVDVIVRNCFGLVEGSAIWNSGSDAVLKLTRCTLEGNSSPAEIYSDLNAEMKVIEKLTIKD